MKNNIKLLCNDKLFASIGASPRQLHMQLNTHTDIRINGSLSLENEFLKSHKLIMKANICDENGSILYILETITPLRFILEYNTFTLYCNKLSRFVDISKIDHVVLYPSVN